MPQPEKSHCAYKTLAYSLYVPVTFGCDFNAQFYVKDQH